MGALPAFLQTRYKTWSSVFIAQTSYPLPLHSLHQMEVVCEVAPLVNLMSQGQDFELPAMDEDVKVIFFFL